MQTFNRCDCEGAKTQKKTQRREDAKKHQNKIETVFVAVSINSGANQTVVQIKGCLSVAAMPHAPCTEQCSPTPRVDLQLPDELPTKFEVACAKQPSSQRASKIQSTLFTSLRRAARSRVSGVCPLHIRPPLPSQGPDHAASTSGIAVWIPRQRPSAAQPLQQST